MPPGFPMEFAFVWQDRDLRFDTEPRHLASRRGETIIDSINAVEDTKVPCLCLYVCCCVTVTH